MFRKTISNRNLNQLRDDRRGIAAVEFAICLPVLLLILMGVLESCSMIFLKQSLAVTAYEGAHTAVVAEATSADVVATCNQILADRGVNSATITITPSDITSIDPGEFITVNISAPADANRVVPLSFFGGQILQSQAVFMKEI